MICLKVLYFLLDIHCITANVVNGRGLNRITQERVLPVYHPGWSYQKGIENRVAGSLLSESASFNALEFSSLTIALSRRNPTVTCVLFVPTGSVSSPRIGGGAFRSSFDIRSRFCSNRKLCEAVSSPDVFPVSALLVQFAYL